MNAFSDELRLLWVVLLNGGVFAAAFHFARRRGSGGALQAICDAFLLYFLTQYAAVGLPGIFGVFNAWMMSLVALVAVLAMILGSGMGGPPIPLQQKNTGEPPVPRWTLDHLGLLACALFAGGYLAAYAWSLRFIPPFATDALVYQLPMAVQWIQTHRLGIYPAWYWNPAASYSPETGSMFMAWWMAPAGNDLFVRYVQLPPLLFIFFLVARMCRLMGCTRTVAGLIAIGATLSRPLFSEAIFPKDDLYVTSFIAVGILSLATIHDRLQSSFPVRKRLNPWRVGVALGFVLASKYTVLLACPVFLFLIDSPFRARWRMREWAIAVGIVLLMAAPWYVRNVILTGNPLYPVDVHLPGLTLHGLFGTERDQQLRSAGGAWHMLSDTYHSLPTPLIALLFAGWAWTCIVGGRSILRDPLPRACLIGSVMTLILFLATSPHHEVRYIFPLIVLWFAGLGFGLARRSCLSSNSSLISAGIALAVAVTSTITTFDKDLIGSIAGFAGIALAIAIVGAGAAYLQMRLLRLSRDRLAMLGLCVFLVVGLMVYVEWHAYVLLYQEARFVAWGDAERGYARQATIWKWVDENIPKDATLAYANTFFVYPYYGSELSRNVVYAPIRKDLVDFAHFPRMGDRVPGDLIVRRMTEVMNENPDRNTWLDNLRTMHAGYLVVMKGDPENPDLSADPPELRLARSEVGTFVAIQENETSAVFRIDWK